MNPDCKEPEQDILDFLDRRHFCWIKSWFFHKNGIVYDLSSANIMLIDEIEKNGHFVINFP